MRVLTRAVFLTVISCLFGLTLASPVPASQPQLTSSVWTVPDAPIIGVATAGDASVTINFTPPFNDGGSAILFYNAICSVVSVGTSAPITVSGLTNGISQSCRVTAINAIGASAASEYANTVTPRKPTSVALSSSGSPSIAGNGVTFTATITPTTATGTVSFSTGAGSTGCVPAPINAGIAICNTSFSSIGVRAISANYGGDTQHSASNGLLPGGQTVNAPTITIAPALTSGVVGVAYGPVQMLATGGVAPHQFVVESGTLPNGLTLTPQGVLSGNPSLSGSYSFSVRANDANNFSGARAYTVVIVGVPGAPVIGTATRGNAQATVTFTAPNNTGGSPITGYTATCGAQSANGAASPIVVTGLSNGVSVTCSATAINVIGNSTPSAASNSVTPATVPDAPSITGVAIANATVSVSFTSGSSNGGAAVTLYNVFCSALSNSGASSPISVSGLANGVPVTCQVNAVNAVGASALSPASANVTPGVAPLFTSVLPPGGALAVSYSHTVTASGAPTPSYALTSGALPAGLTLNSATGLISGTPTTLTSNLVATITASNGIGTAATQSFSISITASTPNAPVIGAATPGNTTANIAFSLPVANGATIIDYTALCTPGNAPAVGTASPLLVAGLSNGVLYRCAVSARSATGSGPASAAVSVIPSATFSADLSISISNNTNFVTGGAPLDYVIRVSNPGPAGVAGARVQDQFTAEFSALSWACTGQSGAQCLASGNGNLDQLVDLPPSSSVQIILNATPAAVPENPLSAMASVLSSAAISDPVPGNNVATDGPDLRGLFRNGFE